MFYHQLIPLAEQLFGADAEVHVESAFCLVIFNATLAQPIGHHKVGESFVRAWIDYDEGTVILEDQATRSLEVYELRVHTGRQIYTDGEETHTVRSTDL